MICAKALAVGPGKSFSVYVGQGDFENDCTEYQSTGQPEGAEVYVGCQAKGGPLDEPQHPLADLYSLRLFRLYTTMANTK